MNRVYGYNKISREFLDMIHFLMVIHISYLQSPFHPRPIDDSCLSIASLNQRVVCVEYRPAVVITLRTYSLSQIPGNSVGVFVYSPAPRTPCSTLLCTTNEVDFAVDVSVVGTMRAQLVFHEHELLTNPLQQLRIGEVSSTPCRTAARAWE